MLPVPDHLILPLSCRKIPLRVRYSERASGIRLRILDDDCVELVLPAWCTNADEALLFAKSKASWVEKILSSRRKEPRRETEERIPEKLMLDFMMKTFPVRQEPSSAVWTGVRIEKDEIILSGNLSEWRNAFRDWIVRIAPELLLPFARETAGSLPGFPAVREYRTKLMKSRWGSCSSGREITLNSALLFFRPEIVRSVVIHELCHLHEMNHSPRFWKHVYAILPEYPALKKELCRQARLLPVWLSGV